MDNKAKEFDWNATVTSHMKDGEFDVEGFRKVLDQNYVTPTLNKKLELKQDEFTNNARAKVSEEIFSGLKLDNVKDQESFKLYSQQLTGGIDETKQSLIKAQSLNTEWETKYNTANSKINTYQAKDLINKGITDNEKYATFLVNDFKQQVTPEKDYDTLINEYQEANKAPEIKPEIKTGITHKEKEPVVFQKPQKQNEVPKWKRFNT